jgi:hypothetical protein
MGRGREPVPVKSLNSYITPQEAEEIFYENLSAAEKAA